MSGLDGWVKACLWMPASPQAQAIRDALSNVDSEGNRPQEFLSGFVQQAGGEFVATYVTKNLAGIQAADDEPSVRVLFVQDLSNGLHLGQSYIWVNRGTEEEPIWDRQITGNPTHTPHPNYEDFIAGGLTKAEAFQVNKMLGTP